MIIKGSTEVGIYPEIYMPMYYQKHANVDFNKLNPPEPLTIPKKPYGPFHIEEDNGEYFAKHLLQSLFFFPAIMGFSSIVFKLDVFGEIIAVAIVVDLILISILTSLHSHEIDRQNEKYKNNYDIEIEKYNIEFENYEKQKFVYDIDLAAYNKCISILQSQTTDEEKYVQVYHVLIDKYTSTGIVDTDKQNTVKQGITENSFADYMRKNTKWTIYQNLTVDFVDNNNSHIYNYYPDIAITIDGKKFFDIEIDEPYSFDNRLPIHTDDTYRNQQFLSNQWCIIRFSEQQIVTDPAACLKVIQYTIRMTYDGHGCFYLPDTFIQTKWNYFDAKSMAVNNFREMYLDVFNLSSPEVPTQNICPYLYCNDYFDSYFDEFPKDLHSSLETNPIQNTDIDHTLFIRQIDSDWQIIKLGTNLRSVKQFQNVYSNIRFFLVRNNGTFVEAVIEKTGENVCIEKSASDRIIKMGFVNMSNYDIFDYALYPNRVTFVMKISNRKHTTIKR